MSIKAVEDAADAAPPVLFILEFCLTGISSREHCLLSTKKKKSVLAGKLTVTITSFCIYTSSSCTTLPCVCMTLLEMLFNTYAYNPEKMNGK